MTDIDQPVEPEREFDENTLPKGSEVNSNLVPEDSLEVDLARNQEPVLDDSDNQEPDEDDESFDGPETEGA